MEGSVTWDCERSAQGSQENYMNSERNYELG